MLQFCTFQFITAWQKLIAHLLICKIWGMQTFVVDHYNLTSKGNESRRYSLTDKVKINQTSFLTQAWDCEDM
jgi:hypothetical protein